MSSGESGIRSTESRPRSSSVGPGAGATWSRWRSGPLAIAAFFWDAVSLRGALFYFDITEINYPYRDFFAEELQAGRFSRWCPGLYCGLPLFSESQAGYLHPLKYLLYPWLATWQAFNLDTVLSVWLTGAGDLRWLRRHVGPAGALTGAAVFGLSGFVWAHLIHTSMINALASVPFVIWGLECVVGVGTAGGAPCWAGWRWPARSSRATSRTRSSPSVLVGLYGLYRAATERGRGARVRVARRWPRSWSALGVAGLGRAVGPLEGAARPLAAGRRA